nr:hypothetical protein C5F59_39745 [Streptomyces sp. QL37]
MTSYALARGLQRVSLGRGALCLPRQGAVAIGGDLVDAGGVTACRCFECLCRRQKVFCRAQGAEHVSGQLHEPGQLVVGRDAAQFRVSFPRRGATGLFLHSQDHCLASALEMTEGVASRVGRYRLGGLDRLRQLR